MTCHKEAEKPVSDRDSRLQFDSKDELATWLHFHGVDITHWGRNSAKSIANLWLELQNGESILQLDRITRQPLRMVRVVEVQVRLGNRHLVEAAQLFADGRTRQRNRPPSEKMHPHETPLAAARRCILEELAVAPSAITLPYQIPVARITRFASDSYPNLTSEYTFYIVHAHVAGLSTTTFTTNNAAHIEGDPVVAHQWQWQEDSETGRQ